MPKLAKTATTVIKLALLSMLAMLLFSGAALAQNANQAPPDPAVIFAGQPAFSEEELTRFLVDFPKARAMTNQQEAIAYLSGQGWTPDRLTYMAAKVSLTREIIRRGGTKEVINQLPKEAQPQKGELDLVKKYQSQIDLLQ